MEYFNHHLSPGKDPLLTDVLFLRFGGGGVGNATHFHCRVIMLYYHPFAAVKLTSTVLFAFVEFVIVITRFTLFLFFCRLIWFLVILSYSNYMYSQKWFTGVALLLLQNNSK